jgi:hypothetical protein
MAFQRSFAAQLFDRQPGRANYRWRAANNRGDLQARACGSDKFDHQPAAGGASIVQMAAEFGGRVAPFS